MSKLTYTTFKNKNYYINNELIKYYPNLYCGCKRKPRNIVITQNIPLTEYVFTTLIKHEWNLSNIECKKAQLLISKNWFDSNYFNTNINNINNNTTTNNIRIVIDDTNTNHIFDVDNNIDVDVDNNIVDVDNNIDVDVDDNIDVDNNIVDVDNNIVDVDNNIVDVDDVDDAPNIIILNDDEKFRDVNNNIMEIETRGDKTQNGIYFKVSDVAKYFDMKNLNCVLIHKNRGYMRNIHYNVFKRCTLTNGQCTSFKNHSMLNKTSLYLTYTGLCRVLFVSRNKNANKFQDWATNTLFTVHMGDKSEKKKLGALLCGVTVRQITDIFDTNCAGCCSCIYILSLGYVKDLRKTFNIDELISDDLIVYKYGFTKDFSRRLKEHCATYGKLLNVNIHIVAHQHIDMQYTSNAESEMRDFCKSFEIKLNVDNYTELIVLNDKQLSQVKTQYKYIGKEFAGTTLELQNKNDELINKIKEINSTHKYELLQKDLQIQIITSEKNMIKMELDLNIKIHNMFEENTKLKMASLNTLNNISQSH